MEKSELRQILKDKRQKLDEADAKKLSHQIVNRVWQIIDWSRVHFIHSYLPIAANNEVDIMPLLNAARQTNPQLMFATTSSRSGQQAHWLDKNFAPTKKIPDNFQYSLVIVPMLGFDKAGYRLGYGGGYYDWFLAGQQHANVIGVSYELGHVDQLPREDHDIQLPIIVTEKTIYKF